MDDGTLIGFGNLSDHWTEQSDNLCEYFSEQSQQSETTLVCQWHKFFIVLLLQSNSMSLSVLRTVSVNLLNACFQYSLRVSLPFVLTGNEYYHLLTRLRTALVKTCVSHFCQLLRVSNVVSFP